MATRLENARKYMAHIKAPNGFKFDVSRYLYGIAHGEEYPALIKEIKQDEKYIYYKRIYFFKYYNKTGAIYVETFSREKEGGKWQIINRNPEYSETVVEKLPQGVRFSIKLLYKYCN